MADPLPTVEPLNLVFQGKTLSPCKNVLSAQVTPPGFPNCPNDPFSALLWAPVVLVLTTLQGSCLPASLP